MHPLWILNFPTKGHWRSVSRLSDIVAGLEYLESHYRTWGIESLAVPALGCNNGGLEWRVVGPTLYRHLSRLDIPVELYAPRGTPDEHLRQEFLSQPVDVVAADSPANRDPKIKPAWVALVEILARIEREPYHHPVGRIIFQKIAYFATELGLPTGLQYERGSYGPFAADLKSLLTRLTNNGLVQEEQIDRMFAVKPGPTYPDAARAYRADLDRWEPIIDRVADLFLRIQRTQQAEVAATVRFAAQELAKESGSKPSEVDVLHEVMHWKLRRRPPLNEGEVARAIRNLSMLRWLDVQPSSELPVPEEAILNV